jgi:DNA-binding MarR family transcriptional regulator
MSRTNLRLQVDQVSEILHGFIRLKPLLNAPLTAKSLEAMRQLKAFHTEMNVVRFDVSGVLFRLAVILYEHVQPMTMGEVSKELDAPLSTATRMVDWLVSHQYVERSPDPDDRRIVRVSMTSAGREIYQEMNNLVADRLEHVLSLLTPTERRQFISLLRKIARGLEKDRTF